MAQTDIHDALVKSEFDFQGRLGNFLISDLLQMIQLSGKTGTLTLLQGWNNRTITFEKGRITYVASGSRLPSQFDLLVRTGRLTRHQVEAFRQRRPGKTEEEMIDELITRKLLDRAAIDRCNEQLLESAIYTLFLWRNCAFTFKAGEVNKTNGVVVSVDGNHLIIEGTRRVDEWIEISPVVPSVFMIFRKRPHLVERTIPDHLRKVYDCVNGDRDVTGIARATGISQFDAARALYELGPGAIRRIESSEQGQGGRALQALCRVDLHEDGAVRAQPPRPRVRARAEPVRRRTMASASAWLPGGSTVGISRPRSRLSS